jgi:hypothetical protein
MNPEPNELLDRWHHIVFDRDLSGLQEILAEDIEFRSPVLWKPYSGRFPAFVILSNVIEIFEGFAYHRELIDDHLWALEFSANIGDLSLKGIDLIEFNAEGQIQKFEVFIRPANALLAVGEAMRRRLA